MTVTRFAPSPTGLLHLGNLRTAIFNFFLAKQEKGKFILRFDDTDQNRSKDEFAKKIREDLAWIGFDWDVELRQSDHLERYYSERNRLIEMGKLYECFETPTELDLKRKRQLSLGKPPVYDRAALKLSDKNKKNLRSEVKSYWRFKLEDKIVEWEDTILGRQAVNPSFVSDPVLIRADGQYLYTLASVVDDIDYGITNIIRGADHVTNTGVQVQIFQALSGSVPNFGHHSLLVDYHGKALSKRDGSLNLNSLRDIGIEPMAIVSLLVSLGTPFTAGTSRNFEDILQKFDLSSISKAPAKLDMNSLQALSQKSVQNLPYSELKMYISSLGIPDHLSESFWEMAKENISKKDDLKELWTICNRKVTFDLKDPNYLFLKEAFTILEDYRGDKEVWYLWTEKLKSQSGRQGKNLYHPLRYALTGRSSGPNMNKLLPLMISNGLDISE